MEKFIKTNMNTLLVSENNEDYETLVSYGLKNITHFKSPIVALDYFEKHPEMKEQYEIIICGDIKVDRVCFEYPRFTHKITDLFKEQDCHIFYKYSYNWNYRYIGKICLETYPDTLEYILEKYLDKTEIKENNKDFKQVVMEEKEAALPKKLEDIRILFLQSGYSYRPDTNEEVLKNIGIKHFILTEDSSLGLQRYAVPYLGDYDIIIASSIYSEKLL